MTTSEVRALLLTDIVDSTPLAERLGDAAAAALWSAHNRAARDLLRDWRGLEIDRSDGFLLLFDTAADALGYALAYHRALASLSVALQARVGLHVGPVVLNRNSDADVALGAKPLEVEGLAKPIAARLMAVAQGGQTLLSAAARAALGPTTVRLQSHGHWRFKGVAEPVELFEAGEDGAPFTPPPDGAKAYRVVPRRDLWLPLREVRHSLPAERDAFVGRREPLLELAQRFDAGARLVSVLGMGGSGKTRLATRFGWTWLGEFPGGVWFCDVSPARGLDGITGAVALGLDVPLGKDEPVARLGAAIAGRGRCLVILDNFEQVARHAEETIGRWLDAAGQAQFLVTTREVLGLPGEQAYALPPLPGAEAAELFLRRAEAARSGLALTAEDRDAVEPLAKLLDGLPLAIELAAARVRVMPPRVLLARMGERFRLLASAGGRRDRQATLRAAFDWSWELLSPPEKAALAQLSVFEGGFNLPAAEAVLDLSAFAEAPWPVDAVNSLVDKSFVRALPNARFDLLVSIQEYAAEHLQTEGRFPGSGPAALRQAQRRHGAHFAALGETKAIADRCADLDNLAAACRRAAANGEASAAVGALEGGWSALVFRGPFSAAVSLVSAVLAMPGLAGGLRARAEVIAGYAFDALGDLLAAAAHFETALTLAREAGDLRAEARASIGLGNADIHGGKIAPARARLARALALARTAGDRDVECAALNSLGNLADVAGEPERARACYEDALALARAVGHRAWEGSLLGNLGGVHESLGRWGEARRQIEASLAVASELGDRRREGNALCNLGWLLYRQGHHEAACEQSERALAVAREIGFARLECIVSCNLGVAHEAAGRPLAAQRHFEAAIGLARRLGDRRSEGQFVSYLGLLHARQRRFAQANNCFDGAAALLREVNDRPSYGLLLCARAEAQFLAGAADDAEQTLRAAEVIAAEIGAGPMSELGVARARVRSLIGERAAEQPRA